MPEPRWPNLFVVGAAKAGTTSLWRYLDRHPEIHMSPDKEPGFFTRPSSIASAERRRAYLDLWSQAGEEKLRGEASPSYLAGKDVELAIKQVAPDARIVISLREPIDRTHSSYLSLVNDGVERRSFRQAVEDDLAGRRIPDCPVYVKPRLYARGIRRYRRAFRGNVHILFFEELASQPAVVMRELYQFLGVDPAVADQFEARPKAHNQFKAPRNKVVARALRARRLARALVPIPLRDRVFAATMKSAPKPAPDAESVALLRAAYGPDVLAVRRLLGRPLPPAWVKQFIPPDVLEAARAAEPPAA
jgi:hypothetical protein